MVLPGRVKRLPLGDPRVWLDAVDEMARLSPLATSAALVHPGTERVTPAQALAQMNASAFSIDRHIEQLQRIYAEQYSG